MIISSCEKSDINVDNQTQKLNLQILFQFEYINYAWGYSHSGWFIDNEGNVKGYNVPNDWRIVDSLSYISKDDLIYNYNQTDTLYSQIDSIILNEKTRLIQNTLNGELSEINCHGADIGGFSLYCYFWDNMNSKHKRVLLARTGDCEQINTSTEAKELTEYLIQVGKLHASCFWFSCFN